MQASLTLVVSLNIGENHIPTQDGVSVIWFVWGFCLRGEFMSTYDTWGYSRGFQKSNTVSAHLNNSETTAAPPLYLHHEHHSLS